MFSTARKLREKFDGLGARLALVLAVSLLPLMIVSILRSQSVINEAEARSQAALVGETLRAVQETVSLIDRARSMAETLAKLAPGISEDPVACSALMRQSIANSPFSFAGYYDLTGFVPCSTASAPFSFGVNPDLVAQIENPVPTVLVNEQAPASRTSVIYASHPIWDPTGTLVGFAAVSVPHYALEANNNDAFDAVFLTAKQDQTVLTGPGNQADNENLLPRLKVGQSFSELPQSFIGPGRDGQNRTYAIASIVSNEIYAIGMWTTDEGLSDRYYFSHPSLFPVLMWLASLAVAVFAARLFVTQHVVQLRRSMRSFSMSRQRTDLSAFDMAPTELRDVAGEFVGMTDTIMREEARLEDIGRQKDVLLREVHHRVKNNLQLIASIMSMQMRQSRSPEVKGLIRSLHDRVNSLATVHRELYQTSGQADIRIDELLKSIVTQVLRMGTKQGDIEPVIRLEQIRLNPDQAVPLALFVTEALTNALKYIGAADGGKPTLVVELSLANDSAAVIEIANSMPDNVEAPDAEKSSGLGSELMGAFGEQLDGVFERGVEGGRFVVRLRFPIEALDPKMSAS